MSEMEKLKEQFKDIEIEQYDFISHTPDGKSVDYKAVKVKFNMKSGNSISSGFFETLRILGLEIHHILVLPAGLYPQIELILYYQREELQ